jgi:hypothetical protein
MNHLQQIRGFPTLSHGRCGFLYFFINLHRLAIYGHDIGQYSTISKIGFGSTADIHFIHITPNISRPQWSAAFAQPCRNHAQKEARNCGTAGCTCYVPHGFGLPDRPELNVLFFDNAFSLFALGFTFHKSQLKDIFLPQPVAIL